MARFDAGFDRETLALARKAGCYRLGFGLESANQRVLDFIRKGTCLDVIRRILEDARAVDLTVYLQVMLGIPSETKEEAFDTVQFLSNWPDASKVDLCFNIYYVTPRSEIFLNPEKYGIRVKPGRRLPFRYLYPFEHVSGEISRSYAEKLISVCAGLRMRKLKTQRGDR